jgi:hypothetical protein
MAQRQVVDPDTWRAARVAFLQRETQFTLIRRL